MRRLDGASRDGVEVTSAMHMKFAKEGQLRNLREDENDNQCNLDDIKLKGKDVLKQDTCNGLCSVLYKHGREVLEQPHVRQVAADWARHRTL